jgi:signal transduction histidine kinase
MVIADLEEPGVVIATATSDAADRLLSADAPLSELQTSCGGEPHGIIAIPALLELVRQSRSLGLPLARAITVHDGVESVSAWVEVEPVPDAEDEGCRIVLRSWQSAPLPADDARDLNQRRLILDREVAELSALLDARQRILTVTSDSVELADLALAMQGGIGRPFTDFMTPVARGLQALHWRMLDGAPVEIDAAVRDWKIVLIPQIGAGREPSGFELLLVSDQVADQTLPSPSTLEGLMPAGQGLVGADLAPVLRQPIARIVANAETIRTRLAGPLPDAYADYAGEIANAGRLLLGLLDDLSDLETVEAADFATVPERIDLGDVARQAAGILGVRARAKDIVIAAPSAQDHMTATAEFRRVLQILLNLIGNAIRYSSEGSQISIDLQHVDDKVRVVVADQGPGLSPDDQAIVFEKFERLGRSGDGGSGLGLYISRRLARAMGGELSVESVVGEGARFNLDLPASDVSDIC